jgi:two-component system, NtrC family, sensor kinase
MSMKTFSIKIKVTMIAMLICLVSFGVAAFFSTKWLTEEIQDDYKERAMLISLHIIDDLESVMLRNAHEEIFKTLDIYRGFKEVEEVRIFDTKGKEIFFREQGPPEANVEKVLRTGGPVIFPKVMNKKDVTSFIIPIKNKPECYTCHGETETLRGALLLSLNQDLMRQYIGKQEQRFFILFGLIAMGTILATVIAVNRLFLNPLKTIQKGAEAIRRGDFTYQIPVGSRDEIGALAENFNTMAKTLQRYFKELEEKNQQKKENEMRLIMSERLAALGEMASGIAHEVNNPLGTIAACTEALLNRVEKEKIGSILFENYLRIIQDEINRCKNITNSMLSFVRKRDDGKQDVEINEVLDKTLEMVNFQGRLKDVDVLRHYQEEVPVIHNNEGDLRQAFLSIIANAVDAMEGKGTLVIETGTTGNSISTKISDTGPGIPPHLINRIFDPFFTTKSEKGGTGLGLSIADKIIKENNGKIDVTSEEGKGTTFTITLPI